MSARAAARVGVVVASPEVNRARLVHELAGVLKGQTLAVVESLSAGTLNDVQRKTVQALRAAIAELIDQEAVPA